MTALTCAQMHELDRRAIEEFKIPGEKLMDNAGRAIADEAEKMLKASGGRKVTILCGPGNNGGDGFAAGRYLKEKGLRADCAAIQALEDYRGEARGHWTLAADARVHIHSHPENDIIQLLAGHADLVVDALVGTGSRTPLAGKLADWARLIQKSGKPVLAVDIPSGLNADTGEATDPCVRADHTVTLGAMKAGFLNPASKRWTGEVVVADIGYPREIQPI